MKEKWVEDADAAKFHILPLLVSVQHIYFFILKFSIHELHLIGTSFWSSGVLAHRVSPDIWGVSFQVKNCKKVIHGL
jgi:hypothetical protein